MSIALIIRIYNRVVTPEETQVFFNHEYDALQFNTSSSNYLCPVSYLSEILMTIETKPTNTFNDPRFILIYGHHRSVFLELMKE